MRPGDYIPRAAYAHAVSALESPTTRRPGKGSSLRDIAYVERTKIHPLMLEALDLLFKQRGARALAELDPHYASRA